MHKPMVLLLDGCSFGDSHEQDMIGISTRLMHLFTSFVNFLLNRTRFTLHARYALIEFTYILTVTYN